MGVIMTEGTGKSEPTACRFCSAMTLDRAEWSCCPSCLRQGDVVGEVAWKIITRGVSATDNGRAAYLVSGLSAKFLEGMIRKMPENREIHGKSVLFTLHPLAARNLNVLLPAKESTKPPAHWRNCDEADIVVFAPTEDDEEISVGTLNTVPLIDKGEIVSQIENWCNVFERPKEDIEYIKMLLLGLNKSGICVSLEMWVNFVLALKDQNREKITDCVQMAAHTLRIPIEGIEKLPNLSDVKSKKAKDTTFSRAFRDAKKVAGGYARLTKPNRNQDQVDVAKVREVMNKISQEKDTKSKDELIYIEKLLADAPNLLPNLWLPSQKEFCENVRWNPVGKRVFGQKQVAKSDLGTETLKFIEGRYPDRVSKEDIIVLNEMKGSVSREPRRTEIDFYVRWDEEIECHAPRGLAERWYKHVNRYVVEGDDLLLLLLDAIEELVKIGKMRRTLRLSSPKILIRSIHHKKKSYWQERDPETLKLFVFDMNAIKGATRDSIFWDIDIDDDCIGTRRFESATRRRVELDIYLIDAVGSDSLKQDRSSLGMHPRVTVKWQQMSRKTRAPISCALPSDISALARAESRDMSLHRKLKFKSRLDSDAGGALGVTLEQVSGFYDVRDGDDGRMFHMAAGVDSDIVKEIQECLSMLETEGRKSEDISMVDQALRDFDSLYRKAVTEIRNNVEDAFVGDAIVEQANAFGNLCKVCSRHTQNSTGSGQRIQSLVAEIGIVRCDEADELIILAGWHPFRLAEKRAKIIRFSKFILSLLATIEIQAAYTAVTFDRQRRSIKSWYFPRVAVIDNVKMIAIEDIGGYSLMAPLDSAEESQRNVERFVQSAATMFMDSIDEYLEIFNHKTSSLVIGIYESNSISLLQHVILQLEHRMEIDHNLHCEVILIHSSEEELSSIYRNQNDRLAIGLDKGAYSIDRLIISAKSSGEILYNSKLAQHIDVIFAYNLISQKSKSDWICEKRFSDSSIQDDYAPAGAQLLQRRADVNAKEAGIYLVSEVLPKAVQEYQDLLYGIPNAIVPDDRHATLVRRAKFTDLQIQKSICDLHKLAKWVVNFDDLISKRLLKDADIEIIRDISDPSVGRKLIVSSLELDERLIKNVQANLMTACDISEGEAKDLSLMMLRDIHEISGRKLLSAARYVNVSQEVIGLYMLRNVLEASRKKSVESSVWLSLDDCRSWLIPANEKFADVLSVSICGEDSRFRIYFQVGEAKFVSSGGVPGARSEAQAQVRNTVRHLRNMFIDNIDLQSRKAWCSRLYDLLSSQCDLSSLVPKEDRRASFIHSLIGGNVSFGICGDAVISIQDEHDVSPASKKDEENDHIRLHVMPTSVVCSVLRDSGYEDILAAYDLNEVTWYFGESASECDDGSSGSAASEDTIAEEQESHRVSKQNTETLHVDCNDESEVNHIEVTKLTAEEVESIDVDDDTMPRLIFDALLDIKEGEVDSVGDPKLDEWAESMCEEVKNALEDFDMYAKFHEKKFRLTPNGVLITFYGHPTLTVAKVKRRTSELLTTYGIEVVYIQPGRGTISLSIKREPRVLVPLASTWLSAPRPRNELGNLSLVIGVREDDGSSLLLNFDDEFGGYAHHGTHTLIAGETGSGKGILIQSILLQLVSFNDPRNVNLILIDGKSGVEFSWLKGLPHMRENIITDIEQAKETFSRLNQEMKARYELFESAKVKDIARYNAKVTSEKKIPRIFLVHDEMGSWMAQEKNYRDTVLSSVSSLGMMARAAGIHLILITQRADATAIPTRLRDNMNNRLCLKVQNSTGSRMVLNGDGAERLLGKGHLACKLANQSMPSGQEFFVVQVPYASPEEIEKLVEAVRSYWGLSESLS